MSINTNAGQDAADYRSRAQRFVAVLHRGLQRVVIAVNRGQVANLSGSGQERPGAYPVPVRRGDLRRSADWGFLDTLTGFVTAGGDSAPYAFQIHEGLGTSSRHGRRPFQDDAAERTDAVAILTGSLEAEAV